MKNLILAITCISLLISCNRIKSKRVMIWQDESILRRLINLNGLLKLVAMDSEIMNCSFTPETERKMQGQKMAILLQKPEKNNGKVTNTHLRNSLPKKHFLSNTEVWRCEQNCLKVKELGRRYGCLVKISKSGRMMVRSTSWSTWDKTKDLSMRPYIQKSITILSEHRKPTHVS